jgi:hypothetical protein
MVLQYIHFGIIQSLITSKQNPSMGGTTRNHLTKIQGKVDLV